MVVLLVIILAVVVEVEEMVLAVEEPEVLLHGVLENLSQPVLIQYTLVREDRPVGKLEWGIAEEFMEKHLGFKDRLGQELKEES